jgi:hypothetical protein
VLTAAIMFLFYERIFTSMLRVASKMKEEAQHLQHLKLAGTLVTSS